MTEILPRNLILSKFSWLRERQVLHRLILSLTIILIALGAFGLGRLLTLEEQKKALTIYAAPPALPLATPTPISDNNTKGGSIASSGEHNFVASKNGSKYYPSGCKSASRIKVANQVWFETASAALVAGYTAAAGCTSGQ